MRWPELIPSVLVRVDLLAFVRLIFVCVQLCLLVPFVFVQFDNLVFSLFVIAVLVVQLVVFV